jgi:hypothetical protein
VKSLIVLLQAYQLFSRNAAKQSTLQSNICSAICYVAPLDLSTRKYRDNSYCVRLYSLKLQRCFGVQMALLRCWAARTVKLNMRSSETANIDGVTVPVHPTSQFGQRATPPRSDDQKR